MDKVGIEIPGHVLLVSHIVAKPLYTLLYQTLLH